MSIEYKPDYNRYGDGMDFIREWIENTAGDIPNLELSRALNPSNYQTARSIVVQALASFPVLLLTAKGAEHLPKDTTTEGALVYCGVYLLMLWVVAGADQYVGQVQTRARCVSDRRKYVEHMMRVEYGA